MWNLRIYAVTILALLLFFVFALVGRKKKKFGMYAVSIVLAVEIAMLMLYFLPFFLESPRTIMLSEDDLLSSDFLLRLICDLGGLVLTFVAGLATYKIARALGRDKTLVLMLLALLINTARMLGASFGLMLTKRIISSNHTLFVISKYTSNYSDAFIYATMAVAALAGIMLLIQSLHVNEPYNNPAEHRKIRAKWRNRRRWSVTNVLCVVLAVLTMTVIHAIANQEVELSPIEDCLLQNDALYISFDQVNDGHLHRFAYTSDDGIQIRMIVIQKPNSSSYGVGLDACDVCGETGYYEKDGQVVCNLCDVVMNINTIGFKGGCNPMVIDYSIEDGYIIVPIEGLLEHESEFK